MTIVIRAVARVLCFANEVKQGPLLSVHLCAYETPTNTTKLMLHITKYRWRYNTTAPMCRLSDIQTLRGSKYGNVHMSNQTQKNVHFSYYSII